MHYLAVALILDLDGLLDIILLGVDDADVVETKNEKCLLSPEAFVSLPISLCQMRKIAEEEEEGEAVVTSKNN
jgi:hypothetical protein